MQYDVIVVGKGNAALCAALSAEENGARVLMLEAAPQEQSGGNSRFAGGQIRIAYASVDELKRVTHLTEEEIATSDYGTNTKEEFFDDLYRLTSYRTDPDLSEILDTPPFEAYATTCGITFTFGGLCIDRDTRQVLDLHFHKIPGLYCAGEMVGGLFYFNYPGGTGLVSGAVFGRIAGRRAAAGATGTPS